MNIHLGSDYVKQTSPAGLLRTDFDRTVSALKSGIAGRDAGGVYRALPADQPRLKGSAESFVRAYVAAAEKFGRPVSPNAARDAAFLQAIKAESSISTVDTIVLLQTLSELRSEGKIPVSMFDPAGYLRANPKAKETIYAAAATAAQDAIRASANAAAGAARAALDPAIDAGKAALGMTVGVVALGALAAYLLLGRKS